MKVGVLIASALALSGAMVVAENRQGSVVHVTEADRGLSIRVPVGFEIRARIAQPKGTRERWEMRNDPHVEAIEAPQSTVAYGSGMAKGGSEFRVFRIRVIRPGRFPLTFGLLDRMSSPNPSPSQRIVIDVDAPRSERDDGWGPRPNDDWNDGPDTVEPLTEADAGRQIDVPVDQEITIALPSNTSTGYHWEAVFRTNLIVEDEIEEERPRGARIGAGGTSLARVRVLKPGRAEVTLMYLPPGGGTSRKSLTYRFRGI